MALCLQLAALALQRQALGALGAAACRQRLATRSFASSSSPDDAEQPSSSEDRQADGKAPQHSAWSQEDFAKRVSDLEQQRPVDPASWLDSQPTASTSAAAPHHDSSSSADAASAQAAAQQQQQQRQQQQRGSAALVHPEYGYAVLGGIDPEGMDAEQPGAQQPKLHPRKDFAPGQVYSPQDLNPYATADADEDLQLLRRPRDGRRPRLPSHERISNEEAAAAVDFRNTAFLERFLTDAGRIKPRRVTKLRPVLHNKIARAVRMAQNMALLPTVWRYGDEADASARMRQFEAAKKKWRLPGAGGSMGEAAALGGGVGGSAFGGVGSSGGFDGGVGGNRRDRGSAGGTA